MYEFEVTGEKPCFTQPSLQFNLSRTSCVSKMFNLEFLSAWPSSNSVSLYIKTTSPRLHDADKSFYPILWLTSLFPCGLHTKLRIYLCNILSFSLFQSGFSVVFPDCKANARAESWKGHVLSFVLAYLDVILWLCIEQNRLVHICINCGLKE